MRPSQKIAIKVGILARYKPLLIHAEQIAFSYHFQQFGTTWDQEMDLWLQQNKIDALIFGGGVEESSRNHFTAICTAKSIPIFEAFGPDDLKTTFVSMQKKLVL